MFACGPADATAIPKRRRLLPHLNPDWLYHSGTGLTHGALEQRLFHGCRGNSSSMYVDGVGNTVEENSG